MPVLILSKNKGERLIYQITKVLCIYFTEEWKHNNFPILKNIFVSADRMLKGGRGRSRAGSLSSPTHIPAPRLGVSGLYTDHMERRKYSMAGSISPPNIPSPPPPRGKMRSPFLKILNYLACKKMSGTLRKETLGPF